jgi:hypothetical protein
LRSAFFGLNERERRRRRSGRGVVTAAAPGNTNRSPGIDPVRIAHRRRIQLIDLLPAIRVVGVLASDVPQRIALRTTCVRDVTVESWLKAKVGAIKAPTIAIAFG